VKRLAEDLYLLRGFPPRAINVYLAGDVIVDAGTRLAARRILAQVSGHPVSAHALTHAHPDHQGSSHELCQTLGIALWCGRDEVGAVQSARPVGPAGGAGVVTSLAQRGLGGPAHPVGRVLQEGDAVADFEVLETPGHAPGHIALWRERDRVLIAGDVLTNVNVLTGVPGLHEPPAMLTPDPARNRQSARRLAALDPELVCFGHGPPLRDPRRLAEFVDGLAR